MTRKTWLIAGAILLLSGAGGAAGFGAGWWRSTTQSSVPMTATSTHPVHWDDTSSLMRYSDGTNDNYVSACVPSGSGHYCSWNGTSWADTAAPSAGDPNTVYALQLPGLPNATNISHGFFWQPSQTMPDTMFWRMWLRQDPGGDNAGYVISDGYGAEHALLLNAIGGGNIWTTAGSLLTFGSDDTVPVGQWYEEAVEILQDYNGTVYIETFFNGVCVGATPLGVGVHRKTADPGSGAGTLYVGGSTHLNWNGSIAYMEAWDQKSPYTTITNYAPERFYSKNNDDFSGNLEPDFFADYTHPARTVDDLSWGYNGSTTAPTLTTRVKHPGAVWNYGDSTYFQPYGLPLQPPTQYPVPKFVATTGGPWTTDAPPTPPGGRSITPPSTPPGAKIFDSFSRQDQTYAYSNTPTLGSTETGSLGPLAWSMGVPSGFGVQLPSTYGIFNGRAVAFGTQPTVAWVNNNSADMTVSVDGRLSTHGQAGTGVAFRVQDKNNYWVCSLTSLAIASSYILHFGYFSAGVYTSVNTIAGIPKAQYTVEAITSGSSVTCQIGDGTTYKMTTSNAQFQTATGAGIANQVTTTQANEGLLRWDNFTVL